MIFFLISIVYCDRICPNLLAPCEWGMGEEVRALPEKGGAVGDAAFSFTKWDIDGFGIKKVIYK